MTHALNMHTDATIRRHNNGDVTISCGTYGVRLSPGIATMVRQAAGSDPCRSWAAAAKPRARSTCTPTPRPS